MTNRKKYISRLENQLQELKALNHEHDATERIIKKIGLISDEEYDLKYHHMEQIMFNKNESIKQYNTKLSKL